MKKITFLFIVITGLFQFSLFAQENPKPVTVKFLGELGLEYGGDELLEIFFTNGEDQKMLVGQGIYLAAGAQFEFAKIQPLLIRTSVGFKYNTTAATNANIRLTRVPILLMPYYRFGDGFRVGAGITTHELVYFRGDDFVPDIDFNSSLGSKFEFGYKAVALSYTSVKYTAGIDKLSAWSIGLNFSFVLSRD
ncbi:hypothetical protein [Algoriphagus namhaensis]